MDNSLLVIIMLSSILLSVLAVGVFLALKFKQYRSRPYLLASLIFLIQSSGILLIISKSVFSGRISAPFDSVLKPELLFAGFLPLFSILVYITDIKFPKRLNLKNTLFFLSPALIISAILMTGHPIPIHSLKEVVDEISHPYIVLRLVLVSFYLIYPILIACMPYDWHRCLVSRKMIIVLEVIFILTSYVFIPGLMCGYFPAIVMNFFLIIAFDILVAYIELKIRIPVTEPIRHPKSKEQEGEFSIESPEVWMNPDMTVTNLIRKEGTNHTYLLSRIKELGYSSYSDMINRKRVEYICKELKKKKNANIISLMFEAGFRSRSTASRVFKQIKGCSPSEYQDSISNK